MTLAEFQAQISLVARNSGICTIPIVLRLTTTAIKVRVELVDGDYMDTFNEVSGRTAFALIDQGERIFVGADNAGVGIFILLPPGRSSARGHTISFAEFVAVIERHLVE